ncbi:zinc ribbon domain-containing protein [Arthrobacter sp. zg-Y1219]|uniref:zinc ribbon domain-containing protein n=1 Tax=Arthrobacter sp. zg-Y1219 TaxID=3049067 RepID=UPI0024C2ED08|nr:zinc ribbon domain-containing protein [Arthrobacter sp. zg-Y1219]MDK1361313.1 zinc ribbon domain-containing protein [Arthrobacter sp. zg-Y1219]
MTYCMSCGTKLEPEWQFCANCRHPVSESGDQQGTTDTATAAGAAGAPASPAAADPTGRATTPAAADATGPAASPAAGPETAPVPPNGATPITETGGRGPQDPSGPGGSGGSGGDGTGGPDGPATPRKKTNRKAIIISTIAVVLVVVGVGAFLFIQNMLRGGAGSPEKVAENLIESIETKDAIGLVTMVAPAERDTLQRLQEGLTEKVEEFGILEAADKVGEDTGETDTEVNFDGITVTFENVEPEIEEVDDQLAVLKFTSGTVRVQVDPEQTTGAIRSGLEAADEMEPIDETTDLADVGSEDKPLLMAAVKDNGRWYLSPLYTGLEMVTQYTDTARGTLPEGTDGSGSPAEAAQSLIGAVPGILQSGKFTDLGNYLSSYEGNAVHYYGGALNEQMDGGINVDIEMTANSFQDAEEDGDRGLATVENLEVDVEGDTMRLTSDCIELEGSDEVCRGKSGYVMHGEADGESVMRALPPLSLSSLKEDGKWKVSLMDTSTDWVLQWLDTITREQALAMLDLARSEDAAGTMVLGEEADVKFNSAGYAVMSLEMDEATQLDSTDEYSSFTVYSADGKEEITSSGDYQPEETPAGEYKVVVFAGDEWADEFAGQGNDVEYSSTMTFDGVVEPPTINGLPGEDYGYLSVDGYPGSSEELSLEVPKGNNVDLVITAMGSYAEWDKPGTLVLTLDGKDYTVPVGNDEEELVIPYPDGAEELVLKLELKKGGGSGSEVDYKISFK